jgi:hypothetical protein
VTLIGSPTQGSVFADLLRVLRFHEGIVLLLSGDSVTRLLDITAILGSTTVARVGLTEVGSACIMFYEDADDLLATVIGSPEQRVPAILLKSGRGMFRQPKSGLLCIVIFAGLQEEVIQLFLLELLLGLFFLVVVIPAACSSPEHFIFGFCFCHFNIFIYFIVLI